MVKADLHCLFLVLMGGFGLTSRDCSLLKSLLGRTASATDVPCDAHVVALLAQVHGFGKDVHKETRFGQESRSHAGR